MSKSRVYIPFNELPEARVWQINNVYKIEMTVRQKEMTDEGATFEIMDVSSFNLKNKRIRHYLTEGGYQKTNDL